MLIFIQAIPKCSQNYVKKRDQDQYRKRFERNKTSMKEYLNLSIGYTNAQCPTSLKRYVRFRASSTEEFGQFECEGEFVLTTKFCKKCVA